MGNPLGPIAQINSYPDGWVGAVFPKSGIEIGVLVEAVDGRPEITSLRICPVKPQRLPPGVKPTYDIPRKRALRSDDIRRLPLRQLRDMWLLQANGTPDGTAEGLFEPFKRDARRGPQPVPQELLQSVAIAYAECVEKGLPVLATLGERFHVSRAGATKYVRKARDAGYLEWPTRKGIAGVGGTESPFRVVPQPSIPKTIRSIPKKGRSAK